VSSRTTETAITFCNFSVSVAKAEIAFTFLYASGYSKSIS